MIRARSMGTALAVVLVLLCNTWGTPASAQDVSDYQQALEQALAAITGSTPDAARAVGILEAVEPVALPDGGMVQPDLDTVLASLRANPPAIEEARARLNALIEALDMLSLPPAAGDEARQSLEQILAREEFAVAEPEEVDPTLLGHFLEAAGRVLERIFEPIAEWLAPLFDPASDGEGADVTRVILGLVGIASVVVFIIIVVRGIRQSMTSDVARIEVERATRLSSLEARAEAERLFQDGNYRAALRSLYLATLLRLEEAGRLRLDRSLTNQEVLQSARIHGDALLLERLSPLVERFDRVWYGAKPCSPDDYRAFARLADRAWEVER